ncbi:PrpR N-terminal domain-containing protein [Brevibacillus ruminantium]|uniref:PrpR N-terminal domain-containing protein n=1 Tax=Brevibacillus ruminantium TaxID=2950604 RepID=A0ABY4WJW5_9BACL|nr:PrpR N-terminal domain-containing protein [Brevibacillus ruminantium]USG67425.1 PrpR N-terminal domain-containing protein [Brevibacillus ruminantium]
MTRILVVAPYQGMCDVFLEMKEEVPSDVELDVQEGDLYKGLALAKSLEDKGYDVIISRGATARLLRSHCNMPVVEVKISGYDILRTLTLVKGYTGKIGLMSYMNTIHGADAIGTLLDMNLTFFPIDKEEEIENGLISALEQGVQVIIGDVISTSIATRLGLQAILITSGKEAVMESIMEAIHMAYYTRREKEARKRMEAVIQCFPEGIVAVDEKGRVIAFNQLAEELFRVKKEFALDKPVGQLHPLLSLDHVLKTGESASEEVVSLNSEKVLLSKQPLLVEERAEGGIAIISTASRIQRAESRIRQSITGYEQRATMHFNQLVAGSAKMQDTLKIATQASQTDLPVLIYGEPGTGKQSFAQAIHNAGARKDFPFVFINCEAYSEEQLSLELFGSEGGRVKRGVFELAHGGTLFIDAVGKMPLSVQAMVFNVLQEKKVSRLNSTSPISLDVRIICANAWNLKSCIEEGEFREDLFHLINGFSFAIPPLRERKEDIVDLVRWFIASFNSRSGKQIVGMRPEALAIFERADWHGNIQELKSTVEKLCLTATGPFITKAEVEQVVSELGRAEAASMPIYGGIDISGKTLEEIERDIIWRVLEEEGQNQSEAARRLGINRSTLWRKIKQTPNQ